MKMAFLHWEKAPVLRLSVLYYECLGPTVSLSWDFSRAMGWRDDVLIFVIRYPGPKSSYETHLCFMYALNTLRVAFYTCVFSRHEFLLRHHMRSDVAFSTTMCQECPVSDFQIGDTQPVPCFNS